MFDLEELCPEYVVNSKGERKPFRSDKISSVLNKETGLDINMSKKVSKNVMRKLINIDENEVSTSFIRELICVELSLYGLYDYRELFIKGLSYSRSFFKLDDDFVGKFDGKQPNWGDIGYITYKRTYSRFIESKGRKEEFNETLQRVIEGSFTFLKNHCMTLGLPWNEDEQQDLAQKMFLKCWNFKMLPPGRGLWIMGTEFITRHGSMSLNNCGFVSTIDIDIKGSKPFCFLMDSLMVGVGVGFDTMGDGRVQVEKPIHTEDICFVEDSREGWVECLGLIIDGYLFGKEIPKFDYSKIRPAGEPIRGFGGVASGYEPLLNMYNEVKNILSRRIGTHLRSIDILDIMNNIAKCVIAGNVRRSAEIALGQPDDHDFVMAKQDKEMLNSHRWASNNSVFAYIGMDYSLISEQIKFNGEPGIFWKENARSFSRMDGNPDNKDKLVMGVNPCGEQSLESFELCNLVETFPSLHDSLEEYLDTLEVALLYSKSVTLINTSWKETNAVMLKNRRVGISQTGIIQAFVKHGRRKILEWCKKGYEYLKKLDEKYSEWLCVPECKKITTVKPSGTVSLLPGVTPGIHYPHSEYYIRRIRMAKNSDLIPLLRDSGYNIEEDITSPNTYVVDFPIHENDFERSKFDVSIWEQAMNAADYQRYWSDNQVSITITFKKEEEGDVKKVLECFEDKLKSVSFLPITGHGYKQAPYEEITKEEYEKMVSIIKPIGVIDSKDIEIGEKFCSADGKCQ